MQAIILQCATWILSLLVGAREREALVGDLVEEYALRAQATSSSAAVLWYLRQVGASAVPLLWSRMLRGALLATVGLACLAYLAIGWCEFLVTWLISRSPAAGTAADLPLGMLATFPVVIVIAYVAAGVRRGAPVVLGVMMLAAVTAMTISAHEATPLWYRVAYFFVGPAAALIGGALRSMSIPRATKAGAGH